MTNRLQDQVIFITGAARGIGAETARVAARKGARLSLVGKEPALLKALCGELTAQGAQAVWFECDVTNQPSLDGAVAHTVATLGGIDVVIANAGIANNGTVAVNPVDAICRVVEVNLLGVMRTVSATLPHVTERKGHYLLVSSAAAFRAVPGMAAYCASKIGVEYFGDALRMEVAHKGVTVGIAHPAWIDTDLVRDMKKDLGTFRDTLTRLPYPFNQTTSVASCAEAFVRGIERRRRTVFVPAVLRPFAALRSLFTGALSDRIISRDAATMIPRMEAEVTALGRAFGANSAATPESPPAPPSAA